MFILCERSLGSEIKKGDVILEEYIRIDSAKIGLLTACGCEKITVLEKLSIGVMTIGNKLQELGQPLKSEYSYDNNRIILISLLNENCPNLHKSFDFGITSEE